MGLDTTTLSQLRLDVPVDKIPVIENVIGSLDFKSVNKKIEDINENSENKDFHGKITLL